MIQKRSEGETVPSLPRSAEIFHELIGGLGRDGRNVIWHGCFSAREKVNCEEKSRWPPQLVVHFVLITPKLPNGSRFSQRGVVDWGSPAESCRMMLKGLKGVPEG